MHPRPRNGPAAGILGKYFLKAKNFNMLPYRHRLMSSHGAIPREQALSSAIFISPENGIRSQKAAPAFFHRNTVCPSCIAITLPPGNPKSARLPGNRASGDISCALATPFFIPPAYRDKNRYILLFPSGYTRHQQKFACISYEKNILKILYFIYTYIDVLLDIG